MNLPRIYPVVDHASWIPRLASQGVRLVQLRIKEQPEQFVRAQIEAAHGYCRAAGVQLIVNDYWQLALASGCDFVHLGQGDLESADLRMLRRAHVRLGVDQRLQPLRDHQRDVLLARAAPADGARILAAVPGVDDDGGEARHFRLFLLLLAYFIRFPRFLDQLRKRLPVSNKKSKDDSTVRTSMLEKVIDPKSEDLNTAWNKDWEQTLFEGARAKVKKRVDPQKFQIFDCYVRKEWPAEKVATIFGVSVEQVYMVKHRVMEMIRDEVKRMEKEGV